MRDRPISENQVNEAATEALANAMYRYTFGIIADGKGHAEGKGLGTGIGIFWKSTYLILTAAHTMETTPCERLYILLPNESVKFQGSTITAQSTPFRMRRRVALENPKPLLADDGEDIAAFILPKQAHECGQSHFYPLEELHFTQEVAAQQIGLLGYPGATALSVGDNFMATPYVSFGTQITAVSEVNSASQIAISYPANRSVDAHGLSGSGLWKTKGCSTGQLWAPEISLYGLITHWAPQREALIGYKVEELIRFLQTKDQWITPQCLAGNEPQNRQQPV
jgi:hypothetical protein